MKWKQGTINQYDARLMLFYCYSNIFAKTIFHLILNSYIFLLMFVYLYLSMSVLNCWQERSENYSPCPFIYVFNIFKYLMVVFSNNVVNTYLWIIIYRDVNPYLALLIEFLLKLKLCLSRWQYYIWYIKQLFGVITLCLTQQGTKLSTLGFKYFICFWRHEAMNCMSITFKDFHEVMLIFQA